MVKIMKFSILLQISPHKDSNKIKFAFSKVSMNFGNLMNFWDI
jgi:hypothetical protein